MANGPDGELDRLLEHVRDARGFDFTGYKRPSLARRIGKRMADIGVPSYGDYRDYLEVHPDEFARLFDTILINVTGFFRDGATWEFIRQELAPAIVGQRTDPEPIRVWSAGCASGEEAYSLAMIFADVLGADAFTRRVKIYATDVDEDALNDARMGAYDDRRLSGVPPDVVSAYFEQVGSRHVFRKDLRRALIFGRHDLIQDAPISRIDLLVCRNTLMYFNAETQAQTLSRLHFALSERGYLFLGKAEMLLSRAGLFTPVDLKRRVFQRVEQPANERLLVLPPPDGEDLTVSSALDRARDAAFDASNTAQIVVDEEGVLVMANARARTRFGLGSRDVGRRLRDLELAYRPLELQSRIRQAYTDRHRVHVRDVPLVAPGNAPPVWLDVEFQPLYDQGSNVLGCSIAFVDVTSSHLLRQELERANRELESAYEELQSTNEELETTNEELQSTVEELETTNEELQSTNEELETMNELLQSSNEELQTINDELRDRTAELDQVNVYLESILTGLRGAVVVVDRDLRVRLWSRKAEDLWGLRATEVAAHHFLDLDIGLPVDELRRPIRDCVASGAAGEVVVDATNRRGRAVRVRVAITPMIEGERVVGAILLMEDGPA